MVGVSRTTISHIESPRPDLQRRGLRTLRGAPAERLADLIGWTVDELVQVKARIALTTQLHQHRLAANLSYEALAQRLEYQLLPAELEQLEANSYGPGDAPKITVQLILKLVAELGWLPTDISAFELQHLPRRMPVPRALGRRARSMVPTRHTATN